jgi:hypothetical protein
MKKIILFFLSFILIIPFFSYAQEEDKQKVGGIRGGWHSASLVEDGSKPDTASNLSTFFVGFFRDQKIAKRVFFGSGLEYFQNGQRYPDDTKRLLHTISIPLNLKIKIGPVYGRGGASANFRMAERIVKGDDKSKPAEGNKSNWFDIAAFAGVGVQLWIISVEARYHWGLLEVSNGLKSRYFQLGAAISL